MERLKTTEKMQKDVNPFTIKPLEMKCLCIKKHTIKEHRLEGKIAL